MASGVGSGGGGGGTTPPSGGYAPIVNDFVPIKPQIIEVASGGTWATASFPVVTDTLRIVLTRDCLNFSFGCIQLTSGDTILRYAYPFGTTFAGTYPCGGSSCNCVYYPGGIVVEAGAYLLTKTCSDDFINPQVQFCLLPHTIFVDYLHTGGSDNPCTIGPSGTCTMTVQASTYDTDYSAIFKLDGQTVVYRVSVIAQYMPYVVASSSPPPGDGGEGGGGGGPAA